MDARHARRVQVRAQIGEDISDGAERRDDRLRGPTANLGGALGLHIIDKARADEPDDERHVEDPSVERGLPSARGRRRVLLCGHAHRRPLCVELGHGRAETRKVGVEPGVELRDSERTRQEHADRQRGAGAQAL